jgi:hypothetical protein
LAILYNQQGDYAAAQPLYERALAIYEATYGPNHQEVAHTLTDLAVLHLEQVSGRFSFCVASLLRVWMCVGVWVDYETTYVRTYVRIQPSGGGAHADRSGGAAP